MLKKIAVTGPESTGKSWLTKQLAGHYKSLWVPEYAREYLHSLNKPYALKDIELIARGQQLIQHKMESMADSYLFSDTEMLVCKIWASFKYDMVPEFIEMAFRNQQFDLYLLCDIDLPWQPDSLREHPHKREALLGIYRSELEKAKLPYVIIRGKDEQRLQNAIRLLEQHFTTAE